MTFFRQFLDFEFSEDKNEIEYRDLTVKHHSDMFNCLAVNGLSCIYCFLMKNDFSLLFDHDRTSLKRLLYVKFIFKFSEDQIRQNAVILV